MIKLFFKTYGCQANEADSEGLISYLSDLGCSRVDKEEEADAIFINSCAVRDKAEQKMFSYLGALQDHKLKRPYIRIGVIGCVASYKKKEIYSRFDHVNFVFGARENPKVLHSYLMDMITSLSTTKRLFLQTPGSFVSPGQDRDIEDLVKRRGSNFTSMKMALSKRELLPEKGVAKKAFVNIMTGCNNYCTYCIVPFTRGREKSYSMGSIVSRVAREVESGAKEITLLGQNVNSYVDPDKGAGFAKLLKEVAEIEGDFWIRYVSPHPKDMTIDVLDVMSEYPAKICDWIHMPLQSGSNSVLRAMNRTYDVDRYMEIINWVNERLPEATITTDIIVGFPGEVEEDYLKTREVMENVKYDNVFSFIYSPRKYTKAYKMPDDVLLSVKKKWLEELKERAREISFKRNLRVIGKSVRALVEKPLSDGKLLARTSGNIRITFNGDSSDVGKFVNVKVEKAGPASLEGSLI